MSQWEVVRLACDLSRVGKMAHAPERVPVDRFEIKRKLSQNKDEETRRSVIAALREEGPYRHPVLADEMERELEESA